MNSLPKRLSHRAVLPASVIAFLVVIVALAGPLFTSSQAALTGGAQSKQSTGKSDSPALAISDVKIMRAEGGVTVIGIASEGWQPGETVEVSIHGPGAGVAEATFNLAADKKGRIVKTNLMLYSATGGLKYLSAVGRDSGRFVTRKFDINGGPFVNTYDSTCTTFKTDFVLGETVCAQVTGINPKAFTARFEWVDPDGITVEIGPTIVMDNQTDTFTIPAMGPDAKTGLWQVIIRDQNDNSILASQGFNVTSGGPQPEMIATFSSDCENPQSSFVGGTTVCAKVTGIDAGEENLFQINWYRPDNSLAEAGPIVTMNNQTDTFAIPSNGPEGTWTVRLIRLSDMSTAAEAGFTVTVIPCLITCPDSTTVSNDPNQCGAAVNYDQPTSEGDCGTVMCSPTSGSPFPVGTTTVTCDASNTETEPDCTFTVTVVDSQAPTVMCQKSFSQPTDPNMCSAVVNYTVPTATDNCPCGAKGGGNTCAVMCSPPPGSTFMVGTTTVTCMATDTSGNKGSCTFNVTVTDTQPPTITCPAPVTQSNDPNQCGAVVKYPPPTASDNCPGVTTMCSPLSGSFFPVGTTTVTCMAMDTSGNKANCSFTVTVLDTQPPTITCPANVTTVAPQTCPPATGAATTFPTPTASDNCPGVTTNCVPPSGSTFPVGTTTVTCTATDASGNTASCSFTVTAFNACLQDDANPSRVVLFNTFTGEYRFCCAGTVFTGKGKVIQQGCVFTLQHNPTTWSVFAKIDFAARRGNASLQRNAGPGCTISDTNIRDNTCNCSALP